MTIIKKSKNQVVFEEGKSIITLNVNEQGHISVDLSIGELNEIIDRPGEYEHAGIYLMAFELPMENTTYQGKIDFLNINLEENNVDVTFVFRRINLNDEIKEKLKATNIFSTNISDTSFLKSVVKTYQPDRLVLLNDFNGVELMDVEKLKGDFGEVQSGENKKVKFASTDFNTEEDAILQVVVL